MKFDDDANLDTSQIDDQRGRRSSGGGLGGLGGGGGRMGIPMGKAGGGLGAIIMLLIALFAGKGVLGGSDGGGGGGFGLPGVESNQTQQQANAGDATPTGIDVTSCRTGADANARQDCRIVAVVNDVNDFWASELPRRGQQYSTAATQFFSGDTQTGCGPATAAVGPFYCPPDNKAYLDLGFFQEFETKFGGQDTAFAEAYVIAHEYGHHIQNLLGISAQVQKSGDREGPESNAVRLELQADCFAGVWAANATRGANPLITEISDQDIRDGLDAAGTVGDDYIQKRFQGTVTPETWTHGSSAQRQKWFRVGFSSGEMTDCDTFNQNI